ncbi:MAG: CPBP family intramembrane metalloprotease [Alphaproteobacteria bacterium]|nr:CPBP family intramembrane metalloprotease [Alphaproteobacteria bacterium]MDE2494858.1 CPBP family intramembrane metalloprotease [Alphaproteobacteria bacterium]MDE2499226.1 CPBP family intramembrane metalloprotease [Alphaproteobacteria bacterium]
MDETGKRPKPSIFHTFARVAAVRLLLFFFVLLTAYAAAQVCLMQIMKQFPKEPPQAAAAALVLCAVLVGIYVGLVRWIEWRRARELALLRGIPRLIGGAAFGFVLFCIVYAVLWAMGIAHWHGISVRIALIPSAITAMVAAVGEELAIRGGVFRILEDSFGTTVALTLSAGLFGLLHALNPGATTVSTVAIALEAGVLLGAAYAVSRNLWLPIGLHFGWNFTEGGIFGASVSGGGGGNGIFDVTLKGADLLTGGAFGPEASVVAVAVCFTAALALIVLTIRNRRWVPMSFHMMLD